MTILVKEGVRFKAFKHCFFDFAACIVKVWGEVGLIPTITSANDAFHVQTSFHYTDQAWDLRVWGLKHPALTANDLRIALTKTDSRFQVIYGDPKHLDHIHVEYDDR